MSSRFIDLCRAKFHMIKADCRLNTQIYSIYIHECLANCLGTVDLIEPYYFDSGVYKHFLFMSYAGRPVFKSVQVKAGIVDKIVTAFTELHKCHILHSDAEPRNVLYDVRISRCMIVDFERASIHTRQPLGPISPSGQNRKRKRTLEKDKRDVFTRELQALRVSLSRCVSIG